MSGVSGVSGVNGVSGVSGGSRERSRSGSITRYDYDNSGIKRVILNGQSGAS